MTKRAPWSSCIATSARDARTHRSLLNELPDKVRSRVRHAIHDSSTYVGLRTRIEIGQVEFVLAPMYECEPCRLLVRYSRHMCRHYALGGPMSLLASAYGVRNWA